jgi:hypothetical protein
VATQRSGNSRGTISSKFLDPTTVPREFSVGRNADVIDNGSETPFTIANIPGFGTVTATCGDENNTTGNENPKTTITFGNTSGQNLEFSRATGTGSVAVANLANTQTSGFTITASNTFHLNIQKQGTNLIVDGVVRQNGQGTAAASCINWARVSLLG